ncbi:unnamed protein product [Trichobilharzia szidati]|nr:unnamed protein product [Trichobilharzia szidati]
MSDFPQTGRYASEEQQVGRRSIKDRTSSEHRENRGDEDSWTRTTTTDNGQHKWEEPERNNLFYLPGKHRFNYRRMELTRISKQESEKQDKLSLLSSLCGGQQHSAWKTRSGFSTPL